MMEREEALSLEDRAWDDLIHAIDAVPAERRRVEGVVPGWSMHDVVWHIAYWVGPGADAVELIRQGRPEPDDEEATVAENAAIAETGRAMTWDEVIGHLERNRSRAREALGAFEGVLPERAVEFFSDYTVEHYQEHESQIRAFAGISSGRPDVVS
ncbi:MAG: DinB family protein [Actinomycetota bacterium]